MRIEHLYYLIDIAKTKSITLSAEHLFISQQGLSQAIHKLETDLNVALFRRCRQGVTLTDAGKMAVEKATEIILNYEDLVQAMEPYSKAKFSDSTEKLSIGVAPFMSLNILPEVLDLFQKRYPHVNLHIEEQQPADIVKQLNTGCIEIGLVLFPEYYSFEQINNSNVIFEKVYENEMFACVDQSSPLANKKVISIAEIKKHPIVVYNIEYYLDMLTHMFNGLNVLNIVVKTNAKDIYTNAITRYKAIGVTPLSDKLLNEPSIATIPIKNSIRLDFGWLVSTQYPLSSTATEFLAIYKSYLTSKVPGKIPE